MTELKNGTRCDPTPRVIRVFVSSTFRDFIAERDRLARFAFPRLRRACEERAVVFTDVDLRWGITEEQAAEGEVLPICLAEIDASRPFFIGILGERYGWVPDHISDELVERHQWLAEHRISSVTELEIVHGVLNDPEMAGRSFFYFRDEAASLSLGPDGAPESDEAKARLADLKARIEASGLPLRKGFATCEDLEAAVLADLTAAIDDLFPEDEVPDPALRERMVHEAFGHELAAGFVERPYLLSALDSHAAGEGPPLLVTGESGSGKSALLAYWGRRYSAGQTEERPTPHRWYEFLFRWRRRGAARRPTLVAHYCGASAASADWASLCRRVAAELERATGVVADLPDDSAELKDAFKNLLFRVAAAKPFVLLLDGVDQLEDRDVALELAFLPPEPPPGCRLIISAATGTRPAEESARRGWEVLTVGDLTEAQRPEVLLSLLSRHAKNLDTHRVARVCAASAAASPLFLSVLADELSVVGSYDTLDETLARYLDVVGVDDVYERVLERWERDYDVRADLVRDTMRAIWAARRGLSERELLEVLGDGDSLPQAYLAPLLLAAGRQLTSRGGLLTFTHAILGAAVADRYLPEEKSRRGAHRDLADHFERDRMSMRSIDELPWQLAQARAWARLCNLLAALPFVATLWQTDRFQALACWALVEGESHLRMVDAYRPILDKPGACGDHAWKVAALLYEAGHPDEAMAIWTLLAEGLQDSGDRRNLQASLSNRAIVLVDRGDLDGATALLGEAERTFRQLGNLDELRVNLNNQARILLARGDLDGAMALHEEEEHICRELGNRDGLQRVLGNKAVILFRRGDLDGARALLKEEERICRELGNRDDLRAVFGVQSSILRARGDLDGAMGLHKEEEWICRELGNKYGLGMSLTNQAVLLKDRGDLDEAMALHKEAEQIFRELGNKHGLGMSLTNQAVVLQRRGDLDEAMALHKKAERIFRALGAPGELATSMANQAVLLAADLGRTREALSLAEEAHRLAKRHGLEALTSQIGPLLDSLQSRGN